MLIPATKRAFRDDARDYAATVSERAYRKMPGRHMPTDA